MTDLDFDFGFTSSHGVDMQLWPIGEASALDRVNDFLDNSGKIFVYMHMEKNASNE